MMACDPSLLGFGRDNLQPGEYDKLEVVYRQGQKPQLVMLNAADERAETVSLTTWDVDTIKEYLNENLAKEDGAASTQAA